MKQNRKIQYELNILLLFLFLHLYRLSQLPFAINVDEAGLWYNVQCLLNYGVDQGNNSWPLLFTNFHGEQSAMYTYLALICVKLFGNTLFAIRLPAVIGACLIFVFGYKIVNKLYNNDKINLLFCILCTICPYFIINCRIALDCNLMLGFSTMFLWFFIKAIDSQKLTDAIIAGISCGLVLYTYAISYITMPIFLTIILAYLLLHKKVNLKQILAVSIPIVLIALPLITIQIINLLDLPELIIGNITFTKFEQNRHVDVGMQNLLSQTILYWQNVLWGSTYNVSFFVNFYVLSIPFLIIGYFIYIGQFCRKTFTYKTIFLFWTVAIYVTFLNIKYPSTNQINALMFTNILFIIEGLLFVTNKLKDKWKIAFIILVIICYLICFCGFCYHYYNNTYNDMSYYNGISQESLSSVLEYVSTETKNIYILTNPIYYKIESKDHPLNNPFQFVEKYDTSGNCLIQCVVNPYGNIILDQFVNPLATPNDENVYIVPLKRTALIEEMDNSKLFSKIQIGHYYIYDK